MRQIECLDELLFGFQDILDIVKNGKEPLVEHATFASLIILTITLIFLY